MSETDWRERLASFDTGIVSDALDRLELRGTVIGIRPMWPCPKIVGRAVTVRMVPAGRIESKHHLGMRAIAASEPGDVIVMDNNGRLDVPTWGDILSTAAGRRNVSGVVIDGVCRDIDGCAAVGFPVYARGVVPLTARGRIVEESTNQPIQCGGVAVYPGDLVIADGSGVVFIQRDRADAVLRVAAELAEKEQQMLADIRSGAALLEVDQQHAYEQMLRRPGT